MIVRISSSPGWSAITADYDGDRLADPAIYHEADGAWQLALQAEPEEEARLRRLATHILPLTRWREGFELLRSGQAVKVLLDVEA